MRSFVSIVLAFYVAATISGCSSGSSTSETSSPVVANSDQDKNPSKSSEGAAAEVNGPTIFGINSQQQREMRTIIASFIEQKQIPGDAAENLTKAFDSAMERVRRPASEFGIQPDADGNLEWPDELEARLQTLRAEYDAKKFFESHEIDLPEWAQPLLDEYKANSISPVRKELLFGLASGEVLLDTT